MTNTDDKKILPEDQERDDVDETNQHPEGVAEAHDVDLEVEFADADNEHTDETEVSSEPVEEILPLLPLKATVILPHTLVPLAAAQERSLRLIDSVMQGDRTVAMVMQKDEEQN